MGGSAYRESLEDREVEEFELHYAPETTYPPTGPTGTMAPVVHKPLRHHRIVSGTSFFLLLSAFILYLLVALSLPIIKGVYLLSLQAKVQPDQPNTSIGTELRFGVWGVCITSALNVPTLLVNNGECTKAQLGYPIPSEYLNVLGISQSVANAVLKGLEVLLVLHPVSAGLSFLTFVQAAFLGNHGVSICALIIALITALISSVTLAADLALVIVAKSKVKDITLAKFEVNFGNAVWMTLVALALTWATVIFLSARACYCCGVRKQHRDRFSEKPNQNGLENGTQSGY